MGQQLLHGLVFLVDRAALGHHGRADLAAMQINGPLLWAATSVLGAFTVGTVAWIGRRTGEGDAPGAAAGLRASVGLALAFGIAAGAVLLAGLGGVHAGLFPEAGEAVYASSRAYLGVALPALPLYLLSLTAGLALAAAGDTRTPFVVALVGNLLNAALTWALVFGRLGLPELGSRGAALATALALAVQCVLLLGLLAGPARALSWRGRGGEREALRRMLGVAGASFGERTLQHAGYLVYVTMIGQLGETAMAANQALLSIESVAFTSADGFGIATAAVVAQRLGARAPLSAAAALRAGTRLAALGLAGLGLLFLLLPETLLRAFASDASVVALGVPCLVLAAFAAPLMGAAVVHADAFRGAGATRAALIVTFVGGVVVRVGLTALLAFGAGLGLFGAWIASTADWAVRLGAFAWLARGTGWRGVAL
ncbi:MAG: MATE family efflux transporter [Myxococcota bacterium]